MCKNYFSVRIFLSLAHLTYVAFGGECENHAEPARSPLQWQFYRFTHATSYNMSIILHCWYVSVLITLNAAFFVVVFLVDFLSLIIVITGCVIFFSLVVSQPLNLSLIKNQWINIFKFIQNRLIFIRFVCLWRYAAELRVVCVVTRYTQ